MDASYSTKEHQKFKGWLRKWTQGRILLLIALFIEILTPAKILSKSFQKEDVDLVGSVALIEQAKKQFTRLENKEFGELPTMKRVLEKVTETDGKYVFQGVTLNGFVIQKETAERSKNDLITSVHAAVIKHLENDQAETASQAAQILNTEGWQASSENEGILDDVVEELYMFYKVPLQRAGFNGSVNDLLEQ